MRLKPAIGGIGQTSTLVQVPGPGQYSADSPAINKQIAYTFGLKTGSSLKAGSHVPGPG